jgi:hypothetical protein
MHEEVEEFDGGFRCFRCNSRTFSGADSSRVWGKVH